MGELRVKEWGLTVTDGRPRRGSEQSWVEERKETDRERGGIQ